MNIAIITLTERGIETSKRIISCLETSAFLYLFKSNEKCGVVQDAGILKNIVCFTEPLHQLVGRIFNDYDGLIFVMATGIVIRVIAPYLRDKYTDPAVVVIDDVGRYVISLLSGHEGGANLLAYKVAGILHTNAVITTGTEACKDIIVGIGCKKGITSGEVINAIKDALDKVNQRIGNVRLLSTVEIKAREPGLLQASVELGIPLNVVSLPEIDTCVKEYSKSNFVKEKIGVWGVCEPVALIAGRKTQLILRKQKYPGITIAIARENFMW
ncbi:MAG: cobalamin biosynthesis protein CbiG [Candidatus Kuenenia sp.]|nr:cobalamin biosynthesis protein CbiG [Candidatus Kuenenia hertensis]